MKQSNLTGMFKALSNEQRLNLFKMLYHGFDQTKKSGRGKVKEVSCCGEINKAFSAACDCINLSRSTISHHFKELENAGLISCTRNGQAVLCRVNEDAVKEIQNFLKQER
ncbi:MAG: helix-turn-helix transcriptional regulator [Deltaproteobacteria bacterium]|nr:helix-turn-helix transcriptional regulator [Deltaproteobacteria bacterium]